MRRPDRRNPPRNEPWKVAPPTGGTPASPPASPPPRVGVGCPVRTSSSSAPAPKGPPRRTSPRARRRGRPRGRRASSATREQPKTPPLPVGARGIPPHPGWNSVWPTPARPRCWRLHPPAMGRGGGDPARSGPDATPWPILGGNTTVPLPQASVCSCEPPRRPLSRTGKGCRRLHPYAMGGCGRVPARPGAGAAPRWILGGDSEMTLPQASVCPNNPPRRPPPRWGGVFRDWGRVPCVGLTRASAIVRAPSPRGAGGRGGEIRAPAVEPPGPVGLTWALVLPWLVEGAPSTRGSYAKGAPRRATSGHRPGEGTAKVAGCPELPRTGAAAPHPLAHPLKARRRGLE